MADTVINTPAQREYDSSLAGWLMALVIVAVIVFGAMYILPRLNFSAPSQTQTPSQPSAIDVNLSVPEGAIPGTQN
ncbi:MAG: hypothetical protein WA021_02535, partial [Minisyncoccia bacterium]